MTTIIRCTNCSSTFSARYVVHDMTSTYPVERCPICGVCRAMVDIGDDEDGASTFQKKFEVASLAIIFQEAAMDLTVGRVNKMQVKALKDLAKRADKAVDELSELVEKEAVQ